MSVEYLSLNNTTHLTKTKSDGIVYITEAVTSQFHLQEVACLMKADSEHTKLNYLN